MTPAPSEEPTAHSTDPKGSSPDTSAEDAAALAAWIAAAELSEAEPTTPEKPIPATPAEDSPAIADPEHAAALAAWIAAAEASEAVTTESEQSGPKSTGGEEPALTASVTTDEQTPTADAPLTPSPVPPAARAEPTLRRVRGRFRRVRLPAICLLGLVAGMGGTLAVGRPKHEPPPAESLPDEPPGPNPWEETDAEKIDLAIRVGRYAVALDRLRSAPREAFGIDERALVYREGLCLEGLEQWKEALEAYKKVTGPSFNGTLWACGTLGQARTAARLGDFAKATALLDQVVLQSGHPSCRKGNVLAECLYFRARLMMRPLGPHRTPDPLDDHVLAWPSLEATPDRIFSWLPPPAPGVSPDPQPRDEPRSVRIFRSRWVPNHPEISAFLPETALVDVFDAIGNAAELRVRVSPAATPRLAIAEPVTLDLDRAPLDEVLTALMGSTGLECRIDNEILMVDLATPHSPPSQRAMVENALRQVVAAGHPDVLPARIALANLAFEDNRRGEAGTQYQQLLEDSPHSPETVYAAHNLGLVELLRGNLDHARAQFLDVVDRQPDTHWADLGWWWVARAHLDAGDPKAARKPLQTVRQSRSKEMMSAATLGACLCDFLEGDEEAAATTLRQSRFIHRENYLSTVGWFQALLRYRHAPSTGRAQELTTALRAGKDGLPLGSAGAFLAGQAYREAGQQESMVGLYTTTAFSARGQLAIRMNFDAAEYLHRLDRRDPARQRYLAVAMADPDGLGPQAELRLAEIAARSGQGVECLRRCRRAAGHPGVAERDLLPVMGRGFELIGNSRLAAECFAGRIPAE